MSGSRSNHRCRPASSLPPIRGFAAQVRQRLATDWPGMAEVDTYGALDVTALVVEQLYDAFNGHAPALGASTGTSPRRMREFLDGSRRMAITQFIAIALLHPAETAPAVQALLSGLGYDTPTPVAGDDAESAIPEEYRRFIDQYAEVLRAYGDAMAGGDWTADDLEQVLGALEMLHISSVRLKGSLRRLIGERRVAEDGSPNLYRTTS